MQSQSSCIPTRAPVRNRGAAILAGGLSGLIATWFKFGWDISWPARAAGRLPETEVLVTMFTHHPTSLVTAHLISFLFSILSGVAYGAIVEFLPIVSPSAGLAFGFAVWIGAHEIVMPWARLTPPIWDLPANEQGAESLGHLLWGLVIGVFYEAFRRRWARSNKPHWVATAHSGIPGATNVDHVGVSVPDLDQAITFFRDVLGAELLFRFEEGPGTDNPADLQKTLEVDPASKLKIAMMRLGPSLNLELMDYRTLCQNRSIPKNSDVDVAHIAFWVEDMDVAAKYLAKCGCRLLEGPFQSVRGPKTGQQIRYFATPWGIAMEILHRPPHMPYEKDTHSRLFGPLSDWRVTVTR